MFNKKLNEKINIVDEFAYQNRRRIESLENDVINIESGIEEITEEYIEKYDPNKHLNDGEFRHYVMGSRKDHFRHRLVKLGFSKSGHFMRVRKDLTNDEVKLLGVNKKDIRDLTKEK